MAFDISKHPRDALGRFRVTARRTQQGTKAKRGLGKVRVSGREGSSKSASGTVAGTPAAKANKKPKDPGEGTKT